MKTIKLILILLPFFFLSTVLADSPIKYEREIPFDTENVESIYSSSKEYIVIKKDNTLYKYSINSELLVSKEILNITNQSIISFKDNYLMVGVTSNTLKLYLLDNNLQVVNQVETSEIMNKDTKFKLYNYDNKIYILLTNNNTLADNNIYSVDENLTIDKQAFSSYEAPTLRSILKADYYLYHKNNEIENDLIIKLNDSVYYQTNNILVGTNTNNEAVLRIYNNEDQLILSKTYEEYYSFKAVEVINDKILVLVDNKLLTIDLEGNILDESIKENAIDLIKISDKVGVIYPNKIEFNSYILKIEVEENENGTIIIDGESKPYRKVGINIKPNSGYVVEEVIVKDSNDNIIPVENSQFTMPDSDVSVEAVYGATVTNPETIDYIIMVLVAALVTAFVLYKTHKKLNWLK